jgi:eukaryotic-like serine/threonine-protein kinase
MGRAIGTPAYTSPEQAADHLDELSPASDVYSLGATLYMLLVGKPAFGGEDMGALLRRVQKGEFLTPRQVNRQVPPALEAVCLKAMALAAGARYTTPRTLADDIEHWLADEPVAVYREALPARLRRWSRRHKAKVSAAVALLLTAVVGLAVGLVAVDQEQRRTQKALGAVDQEQGRKQQALAAEQRRRQQARQALDAMSSAIIDEWLGKQKELLPEHRAFLQQALHFYEEFAQETAQDEEARAGVAAASLRVSGIYNQLGQAGAAEAGYRQSAQLYRVLAADFPNRPDYRYELAGCHSALGILLNDTGRTLEADTAYH